MIPAVKYIATQIPLLPKEWHDCYNDGWQGIITKESFAHPAKFSKALIERIFDHCLERGWLKRGDVVGDCFGGIGNGGIIAAYRGLHWIGVELEPRFVKFAEANFALHADHWTQFGFPQPRIVQGDSRHFDRVVQSGLPEGKVDCVVTSPPFSAPNMQPKIGQGARNELKARGETPECGTVHDRTAGNIETLQPGNLNAVVTSPPYEEGLGHGDNGREINETKGLQNGDYGDTPGQIGNDKGETYWSAMAAVYASCYAAIKPGGVIAVVVKDYVSKGKRVPLCDDTAKLLEYCGFRVVERVHAMLTKSTVESDLFAGTVTKRKERKSFFRRLAEKKGSPPIDFEEVIFAKRS